MKRFRFKTIILIWALALAAMLVGGSVQAAPLLPSLSEVVARVQPSIVYINVGTNQTDFFGLPVEAAASGIIVRQDGYIVTNKHVVETAETVTVMLSDRRVYPVDLKNIWMDDVVDIAVIKIAETNLPVIGLGNPDTINVGDWVIAIGYALGFSPIEGGTTVTVGIVSNLDRSIYVEGTPYYDLIQTDAAINPGSSGGPLLNLDGEVVGINSIGSSEAQNIGFAINMGTAGHVYQDLIQYGKPHHPFLGVSLEDVTPGLVTDKSAPRIGAFVANVERDSPASRAGIHRGDIILNFGKYSVTSAAGLIKGLWRMNPDDTVMVTFWRNGMMMAFSVLLSDRPQSDAV
jgi:serine protease Do